MARGVDGRETFVDQSDRELFLTTLTELQQETAFTLLAYCLMGNHFHLAIKVGTVPLSTILQRLLTRYVSTFNLRHRRTGHLFQARYRAVVCLHQTYLLQLIAYIHANPVRSGLVATPEDWRWSSSQAYTTDKRTGLVDPNALPRTLGLDNDARSMQGDFDPWPSESVPSPVLLRNPSSERTPLESLAARVSLSLNISIDTICSHRKDPAIVRAKRILIANCLREGHSLSDISRWLHCSPSGIHYLAYPRTNLKKLKA
ncbi:MAG TPA: hypothetical protein DCZ01_03015 [Elusimicrobia bacterium]|nr:hypothetical protein [Elusimicrobiota bacterium]